ncbi:MAG: CofH family radical SAM protein [Candidatus Riflebacteria bacterium]|nr:CofH family radical SAM protein [Candidatus Riflebacteria bacterium]
MRELLAQLARGERLDAAAWTRLATEAGLEELAQRADALRRSLQPDGTVGFVIDRNLNYTNVCTARCSFCAFYRSPGDPEGYVLEHDEIFRKVEETLELGGSGILMQGGLHPELPLVWYERLLLELTRRYAIHLHCFSPPEVLNLARLSGLSTRTVLERLKAAGLGSLPGGGAEILVDSFRRRRTSKCTGREWLRVMEEAHGLGISTTATMVLGLGETVEERLGHFELLRTLQARTGGFVSFIPWTFQPDHTALGRAVRERLPVSEYLRWLALSRLYLECIPHLQVSWLTQGLEAARRALHGGADDLGSVMIEEQVVSAAGAGHRAQEETLRRLIVEEGFLPRLRDGAYREVRQRLEAPTPRGLIPPSKG